MDHVGFYVPVRQASPTGAKSRVFRVAQLTVTRIHFSEQEQTRDHTK